jgi:flagellin
MEIIMGLRIRTNTSSLTAQRNLRQNNSDLNNSMEKLSSGFRINKSKDDAAGLAISENLRARTRGLSQAKRNASDGVSMVQIAEGGMNEMTNILVRMRELTVQAASDTVGDRERSFLNREYVQLADEIDRIAATTEFNGNKFFTENENGRTEFILQVGVNGTAPEDNQDTISLDLEGLQFSTEDLNIGKESEIGGLEDGDTVDREVIAEKLEVIDDSLARIASERATLGALQSRVESTIKSLDISIENESAAMSRIKDVDFAEESANMAQARIMNQSSVSVLAQANTTPETALALIR